MNNKRSTFQYDNEGNLYLIKVSDLNYFKELLEQMENQNQSDYDETNYHESAESIFNDEFAGKVIEGNLTNISFENPIEDIKD